MFATRTEQTTQTTGTGTVDLIPALTGRSNFSDTIGNGNACYYIIQTSDESQWEEGWGVESNSIPPASRAENTWRPWFAPTATAETTAPKP